MEGNETPNEANQESTNNRPLATRQGGVRTQATAGEEMTLEQRKE